MKSSKLGTVLQVRVPDQTAADLKALASAHESSRNGLIVELFRRFTEEWFVEDINKVRQRKDYHKLLARDIRVSIYHSDYLSDLFQQIKRVR